MKKVRICLEIQGLGQDEHGAPCPGGLCLTIGDEEAPEISGEEYQQLMDESEALQDELMQEIAAKDTAFLEGLYRPENCRIIPPEEYDRKYGEGDQDAE